MPRQPFAVLFRPFDVSGLGHRTKKTTSDNMEVLT